MADESTTTETTTGTGTSTTTNTGTSPANGGQQQAADAKTYTQAELDKMFAERSERGKKAATSELLETLGVKSLDELKKSLEEKRKRDEAEMSEADKAKTAAAKAKADYDELQKELQQERESRKQEKLDTAIRAAARGAHDTDDVVRILRSDFGERLGKAMKEDGTIETKVLDELIAELKKKKAYLFGGSGAGSPSNHGGKTPEPDAKAKEQAQRELARQIKRGF